MAQNKVDSTTGHFISELEAVKCAIPFDILGIHPSNTGAGVVIRAWFPEAIALELLDPNNGKKIADIPRLKDAMFEITLPKETLDFVYKYKVIYKEGAHECYDPYQFVDQVKVETQMNTVRLYEHMGAQQRSVQVNDFEVPGILFSVYAPLARSVSVIGDFNNWDGRRHPLKSSEDGIWRLFIPELKNGTLYKFELKNPAGEKVPLKADPFGFSSQQAPGNASIVYDHNTYQWNDQEWIANRKEKLGYDKPMSVYEVHLGSWRKHFEKSLSYRQMADELLAYVVDMGYTHIELLPITEHPFDGSWGYQPVGLFAPTSRFGSPDDFKYFVDKFHQAGIAIIVDWVPAHFPNDDHGLANFDGTPLFEHPDPKRGWHPDWNTYIYDYGRGFVSDFLVSNALYWIDYFHIDGLRVDAVASMLYLDYSREDGEWEANKYGGNENLEAIDFVKRLNETVYGHYPDIMTIAEESTSWPKVTKPTWDGGLGFGYKWNMGWMHDTLVYMGYEAVHRKYHQDEITFSLVYSFSEQFVLPLSHDEVVHGKGSILERMPGDEWQKTANTRMYYGFMYGHPGKQLMFMGNDIGQGTEWNYNTQVDWYILDYGIHKGVQNVVKKLNNLHSSEKALHEIDYSYEGFEWIDFSDSNQSVISFIRKAKDPQDHIVVICNFTPVTRENYRMGVFGDFEYEEILNTDAAEFFGSGVKALAHPVVRAEHIQSHGRDHSINLTLPPLSTVYLKPKR